MMNNKHSTCLKPICRLCGSEKAISTDRTPYLKEGFKEVIQASLSVDINFDVPEVHPPYICYCCVLKLKRWKNEHKKKRKTSCNIQVKVFTDTKCSSCEEVPLSLEDYKKEAEKYCLISMLPHKDELMIIRLSGSGEVAIKLTILSNFSWRLVVAGVSMRDEKFIFGQNFSPCLTLEECAALCKLVKTAGICSGNNDFQDLVEKRKGCEGQVPVRITPKDIFLNNTIRHVDCHLLVESNCFRCSICKVHRCDLSSLRSSYTKDKGTSNVPNRYLTDSQRQNKLSTLQSECRRLKRRSGHLQEKIANMYLAESQEVSPHDSTSLESVMEICRPDIESALPQNSPARLLWEQQQVSFVKGKQMRWHPAIVRWCIALQNKSPSAYNLIRETGFLKLPHPNTLKPYSQFAGVSTGFCHEMLDRVVEDLNLYEESNHLKKHIILMFDEMKVKSGLFFSISSGKVIGATDVGSLANEIHSFERRCSGEEEIPVATHMLVLMLRGLFCDLHVPIAYYATTGASSCDLYMAIWEAVELIEVAGFVVHAFVSDGAAPNRKFYRLHSGTDHESLTYKALHQVDPDRAMYFFSDVPHLLKTLRNNLENSGYNNKTRNLHYNKQDIKWSHVLDVYEWDVGMQKVCPGLRMLHKFSYEHLHLTPSSRMRVYMAAQVLSSSTANAMEMMGRHDTVSTIKFIRMVDKFFDCLNVSTFFQGKRTRKPALEPYREQDDWRFEWLQNEFLGFFKEWKEEVNKLEGIEKNVKKRMMISNETLEGLKITINSFVELTKKLLELPDVDCILSAKFNQDPLEQYFSKQRGAGGHNTNPTALQFGHNMQALYVASHCAKASKRGNCRSLTDNEKTLDDTPLQRRKLHQT